MLKVSKSRTPKNIHLEAIIDFLETLVYIYGTEL